MESIAERLRPGVFFRTGHRGARGLAPENTLESFQRATDEGVDLMELDVQMTSDGKVIVLHDDTVDRTTDGRGMAALMTYDEIRELDAGHRFGGPEYPMKGKGVRIPLLEDVLDAFPSMGFTIEVKSSPHASFAETLAGIIQRRAPDRSIVASEAPGPLAAIRKILPGLPTNCSRPEVRRFYFFAKAGLGGFSFVRGNVFQVPVWSGGDNKKGLRVVTDGFIRAAHGIGLPVQVWTVNDPVEMRELIDLGVDGITTDRPDILNGVMTSRGA